MASPHAEVVFVFPENTRTDIMPILGASPRFAPTLPVAGSPSFGVDLAR